jgi:hypothetical protein
MILKSTKIIIKYEVESRIRVVALLSDLNLCQCNFVQNGYPRVIPKHHIFQLKTQIVIKGNLFIQLHLIFSQILIRFTRFINYKILFGELTFLFRSLPYISNPINITLNSLSYYLNNNSTQQRRSRGFSKSSQVSAELSVDESDSNSCILPSDSLSNDQEETTSSRDNQEADSETLTTNCVCS